MVGQVNDGSNISQVYLVYNGDISQPSLFFSSSEPLTTGRVLNSLEFQGIEGDVASTAIHVSRRLFAKTRPEDRPAGFPLLSLTRSAFQFG